MSRGLIGSGVECATGYSAVAWRLPGCPTPGQDVYLWPESADITSRWVAGCGAVAEVAAVLVLQLVLFQLAEEIGFTGFQATYDPTNLFRNNDNVTAG